MADLEAAARALFEHDRVATDQPWDAITDDDRSSYRTAAAAVLAAAGCGEAEADAVAWRRQTARLMAVVAELYRILNARHDEGCTYIRMADIRAALDLAPAEPS